MKNVLGVIGLFVLLSQNTMALSEKAVLVRCYAQITGKAIPLNHSLYLDVKSGKTKAIDACLSVLHKADLQSNGQLKDTSPETVAIFNNFYDFHRTWFPTANKDQILGYQGEFDSNTDNFIELTTPALTITRALFGGMNYSEILRGSNSYSPMRGNPSAINISTTDPSDNVKTTPIMAPFVGTGPTTGITTTTESLILTNYSIPNIGSAVGSGAQTGIDLYRALGGGILGQQGYFLLDVGHSKGQIFDGALKLPRKWAKTALESLLCFNLPALRESDIQQYINAGAEVPFRRAGSCITCHATMDQMATTARNLVVAETADGNFQKVIFTGSYPANRQAISEWSSSSVPNFHRQTPTGKLMIRSYVNGALINQDVNGLEDLGTKLSNLDEMYQCAAKRYFEYFTGINVSLYDRSDPANAHLNKTLSKRDLNDRRFIEQLGRDLRATQSLPKMIESILRSDYYNKIQFNPESGQ
ncbi:MAG: hypothetical protein ACKOX6_14855 [Bdellovibrio sp.]